MSKTYEIALGEKTVTIDSPVILKQLRLIEDAANRVARTREEKGSTLAVYDAMADAILAAVMLKNPEITRGVLDETPMTSMQFLKAYYMVGVAAGLFEEKNEQSGEASAESRSQSTGA